MRNKLFNNRCLQENDFDFSNKDKIALKNIKVPIPQNENNRLKYLREAKIFDSDENDAEYDRYTSLASRIFKVLL